MHTIREFVEKRGLNLDKLNGYLHEDIVQHIVEEVKPPVDV